MNKVVSAESKRRYPRRSFTRKVGALHQGSYNVVDSGEIGEGGMLILLDSKITIGDQLVVSFQVPNGEFVSVRVVVKTNDLPGKGKLVGHGVAFLNLPFHLKRTIRSFVAERSELEH